MASDSSSSIRTILHRGPGKRILDEGDEESSINLNNLEIPNLSQCNSFDFMNEEGVLPEMGNIPREPEPLSPQTLEFRQRVVIESLNLGREEFPQGCPLDYISHFTNHVVDRNKLSLWVDFENNYRYRMPIAEDRVWMMPKYGIHGVPLILFEYGLRLPMHPFHLAMYEVIGCGITQLVPNAIAQVSGFIALCYERDKIPSIKLFFSIYGIRYQKGQVYFDTRSKSSKIVCSFL